MLFQSRISRPSNPQWEGVAHFIKGVATGFAETDNIPPSLLHPDVDNGTMARGRSSNRTDPGQRKITGYTHSRNSPQAGNRTHNNSTNRTTGPGTRSRARQEPYKRSEAHERAAERDPEYRKTLEAWEEKHRQHQEAADNQAAAGQSQHEEEPEPMQEEASSSQATTDSGIASTSGASQPAAQSDTGGTQTTPPAKKAKMATGTSTPGGSGADVGGTVVIRDANAASRGRMTFKHAFQVQTPSLQFVPKPFHVTKALPTGVTGLTTPLVTLDPDNLAMYMTPIEYDQLPLNTWATGCRIKVTPLGYRAPFATNDPSSVFANSQTVVQICHGIGLNKIMDGFVSRYTLNTSDPTEVSTIDAGSDLPGKSELYNSAASCGEPIWWNAFFTPIVETDDTFPNISRFIDIQNINDTKGLPCVDYEYNFKNGRLKANEYTCQNWRHWAGMISEGFNTVMPQYRNANRYDIATSASKSADRVSGGALSYTGLSKETLATIFSYNSRIEKAALIQNNAGNQQTPDSPPLVHFGVMPLSSNTAMPTYKYSPLIAIWEIQCELDIEYSTNYTSAMHPTELIQSCDMVTDVYISANIMNYQRPFYTISGRRENGTTFGASGLSTVNVLMDTKFPRIANLPTLATNPETEDISDSE